MTDEKKRQQRVAIVGSGLAGLSTAHLLHNDRHQRYSITIFEAHHSISLDAASVTVTDDRTGTDEVVDVPMRAFAAGFYANFKALLDHAHVSYTPQPFLFSFAQYSTYFVHSSNNHRIPPLKPAALPWPTYLAELLFILLTYAYWTLAAAFIQPAADESLASYLQRLHMPARFTSHYLLPLMSATCTCSHAEMLAFPASDVVAYKRTTQGQEHYAIANGVRTLSARLTRGVTDVRFDAAVTDISTGDRGVTLTWEHRPRGTKTRTTQTEKFDHVVLAVAPPVVASVFAPLRHALASIPFTLVDTAVARSPSTTSLLSRAANIDPSRAANVDAAQAQLIAFKSAAGHTVSTHLLPSGALVQTRSAEAAADPLLDEGAVVRTARFPRVLRSVQSRRVVNELFGSDGLERRERGGNGKNERGGNGRNERGGNGRNERGGKGEKEGLVRPWRNGDGGVWLAGGWAWDGLVLLEGCVVSAARVARGLGVDVPWDRRL